MSMRTMVRMALGVATVMLALGCAKESQPEAGKSSPATKTPVKAEMVPTPVPTTAAAGKRIEITVTAEGFQPGNVSVPKGEPVTLVFTRKTEKTCATEFILQVDEGNKIERKLPLDQPVEVAVTFPKAGELKYACAMDMIGGVISVE